MRTHTIIRPLAAAMLAAAALAVASCGGDDQADANADRQADSRDAALAFAACMREHGVDMPDPSASGGRHSFRVGPSEDTTPEEFEAAEQACEKYQQEIEPPEMSEEQQEEFREAALAHARCMREHGIENFPDPTFGANGEARLRIDEDSGVDPEDPDFKEAEKACEDELPDGPATTSVGGEPDAGATTGGTGP